MIWKIPPSIKVLEALGSIADGRVEMDHDSAKVFSSSGDKFYSVMFDEETNVISANDNGSYWQGYLGYPAIAFLMKKGKLSFDAKCSQALKNIHWKKVNTDFKNDFAKTEQYIKDEILPKTTVTSEQLDRAVQKVLQEIEVLQLQKPLKRVAPAR
jgi:hypothetical protein